jgi:hypothetical protein
MLKDRYLGLKFQISKTRPRISELKTSIQDKRAEIPEVHLPEEL